jgi:hypothetical protein
LLCKDDTRLRPLIFLTPLATGYLLLVFQEIGEGNGKAPIVEQSKETGQHEDLGDMARHLEEISSCMSRNCQQP